jgi:hypothetical protein
VDAQVVQQHQCYPSTCLGAFDRTTQLSTEWSGPPTGRTLPVEPAVAPVNQPEAILLDIVARRLDQPLPAAALAAPDARERWVQRDFDLVLQVQVGPWQQA